MKTFALSIALSFLAIFAFAQDSLLFSINHVALPDTGFENGKNLPGYFLDSSGIVQAKFFNYYNSQYDSWYGFAYSTWTNDSTNGYQNQWSTFAGYCIDSIFALGYNGLDANFNPIPSSIKFSCPVNIKSLYISNATYTALTIRFGNQWARAFTNGDYYYVKITGFLNGSKTDSIVHYLADFTAGKHFIQKDWAFVDLHALGKIDSLTFTVFSTDTGQYGINTPAYFCIDQIKALKAPTTSFVPSKNYQPNITIYPNPVSYYLHLNITAQKIELFDIQGHKIITKQNTDNIDCYSLPNGLYILRIFTPNSVISKKLIIQH